MTEKQTIKIGIGPLATRNETNNIWIEIDKKNPKLTFQLILLILIIKFIFFPTHLLSQMSYMTMALLFKKCVPHLLAKT